MDSHDTTRRDFLSGSAYALGGAWLALYLPDIEAARAYARIAMRMQAPLATLTAHEAAQLEAVAARIIPSDDGPGAREAGVIPFMDRALGSFFEFLLEDVRAGLRDLDARAGATRAGASFTELTLAEQDAELRQVEATSFFFNVRLLTTTAVFSGPLHGGNRDGVGEALLRIERQPAYQPPFGYYDAEYGRAGGGDA